MVGGNDGFAARVLDLYGEATIAGCLRWTGTHNVPGGIVSTVALAERAAQYGFAARGCVVDIGHSTGAPGRFVARRFGAMVIGIDVNPFEEYLAQRAAIEEGLARRCVPILAAAEQLPLADSRADGAWSQDAMCHMDKRRVVAEVARVLRPGAIFAFTDWIDRGGLTVEDNTELDELLAMPELFSIPSYVEVLDRCGFSVRYLEDRTVALHEAREVGWDEAQWWQSYVDRFGEQAEAWSRRLKRWDELITQQRAGHVLVIARRTEQSDQS